MLHIARAIVFIASIVCAICVLGFSAASLHAQPLPDLAMATSIITVLSLPAMLIVDATRSGMITSMIITELVTLSILSVLWGITSLYAAYLMGYEFESSCVIYLAFSWISWLPLMFYLITLLVMASMRANRGEQTWTISVKHARFFDPRSRTIPGATPWDVKAMQPAPWPTLSAPEISTQDQEPSESETSPPPRDAAV